MKLVELAIRNARLTLSILVFFLVAGSMAYVSIPKEAEPDVKIPIIYVSMSYEGISPEDSERLLLRPMETALKSIQGIKQMTATAYLGGGNVLIEFQAGADLEQALTDVRNKVKDARRDLPDGVDEPSVNEVNISEFPIIVVTLSGSLPERVQHRRARAARPVRGSARRAQRRPARGARRSGRGDHRPGQAVVLRPAAGPDDCRRQRQQPADRGRGAGSAADHHQQHQVLSA